MPAPPSTQALSRRTWAYLAAGIAAGVVYSILDGILDGMSTVRALPTALQAAHDLIDHVLPVVAGALLGLGTHYLRLRSDLAAEAVRSAGELRTRLQKVERDQAAWVVAAATLHEVRNPLHTLGLLVDDIARADAVATEGMSSLAERARTQMDRISAHLTRLRETLGTGNPELSEIDLKHIASDVARDLMPLALEEHVDLSISGEGTITARADEEYVRIILENLIGNGLDVLRSRGKGHIWVAIERSGPLALVRVSDDGPGIDPSVRGALFQPVRSSKERGLGLGLSVGRALARAMEGDLVIEPDTRAGTTLRLSLPAAS